MSPPADDGAEVESDGSPDDGPDTAHQVPVGVDDATVEAVGLLTGAFEVVEQARGMLYGFHRLTGRADNELDDASLVALLTTYDGRPPNDQRLAEVTLMRVVSDFREAAWGVLQQAISGLDEDFVAYADRHFERMREVAAASSFDEALRRVRSTSA